MIKSTDLAYAAGYSDGDGCFYIGKHFSENRTRFTRKFIINTTEIENVQWFQRIFGGDILTKKSIQCNHKPLHRYVLKGENLESFKGVEKFLIEKKNEFYKFNEFISYLSSAEKQTLIMEMKILKKESNIVTVSIKEELSSIRNTIIPTIEDFAYLAGFIDAECCLSIQRNCPKNKPNPTFKIQLQCGNTKIPCFYWISPRFGGQFHFIDKSKYINRRNVMMWVLSSASLFPILKGVCPFLNHKKPVCEQLIKFYETTLKKEGVMSRNNPLFKEFYKPILQLREEIFHNIQCLNKKGI